MKEIQEVIYRLDQLRIDITKVENDDKVEREAYEIQQLLFKAMDVAEKLNRPVLLVLGEQLNAFREWWNEDNMGVCTTITNKDIERYLETF